MGYQGDILVSQILNFKFGTVSFSTGAPTTLAGTPAISVYKNNSSTESTAGLTLTPDFDSRTGMSLVTVDTSADGTFYAAGNDFQVIITAGTVGGVSVVGMPVGEFSIQNRTQYADIRKILGTAATAATAGILDANAKNINNISTSSVAAINANQGTTQPVNFTGTSGSALVRGDTVDFGGTAGSFTSGKPAVTLASTDVTGNVAADLQTIKTQAVIAAAGVTFPTSIGTSTLTQSQVTGGAYSLNTDGSGNIKVSSGTGANQILTSSGVVSANVLAIQSQQAVASGTVTFPTGTIVATSNLPTNFGAMSITATGAVGINWGDVENPTTTVGLSGTTIGTATVVGNVTLAASQPNYAPAKAGDAMTLTSAYDAAKTAASQSSVNTLQTGLTGIISGATVVHANDASGNALAVASTALSTAQWTNARAAKLDDLDAAVSSRLAASSYVVPPTSAENAAAVMDDTGDQSTPGSLGIMVKGINSMLTASGPNSTYTVDALKNAPSGGSSTYHGIAQGNGGGSNTIQLEAGASAIQNFVGQQIAIYNSTGAIEVNIVVSYNGVTDVCTCQNAWKNTITNTTPYTFPGILRPSTTLTIREILVG